MSLALDTLRAHRVSAAVWVAAGGLTMFGMALAIQKEMADFPGGAQALAASLSASVEALRLMRWPAERLDTLGGYLTYHNVILINFMLAIYGAVQGTRAIRRGEERNALEEILATGISRAAVVLERALGFLLTVGVIALGLGLGTAAGLAAAGEPNLKGSLITLATTGLVSMASYSLGLFVSQLMPSARGASGVCGAALTVLYMASNLGEQLGPLAGLRFLSPFHYANLSRALVPGQGLDPVGTAALVAMSVGFLALATWAFARRDYNAPLWSRTSRAATGARATRVPTVMLSWVSTAILRRGRYALLAWAGGAAVLTGLMASLQPTVMEVWVSFGFMGALTGGGPGITPATLYWSFSGDVVSPVVAAWAIAQASGWVTELAQGRVELMLAGPVSWARLVIGRLVALVVGVAAIAAGGLITLTLGALAVGGALDPAGLGRIAVSLVLLGAALGGLAAIAVALLRRGAAVVVLAVALGASYLLAYLVPLFGWPEWLNRLSVFWAFGHPYLEWQSWGALAVLLGLAFPGAAIAALIAERTPKVA